MGNSDSTTKDAAGRLGPKRPMHLTPVSEKFTLEDVDSIDDLQDIDEYVVYPTTYIPSKNASYHVTPGKNLELNGQGPQSTPKVPFLDPFGGSQHPWSEFGSEHSIFTQSLHRSYIVEKSEDLHGISMLHVNNPELESGDIIKLSNEGKQELVVMISERRKNPFYEQISGVCDQEEGCQVDFVTDFKSGFQNRKQEIFDAVRELIYKGPFKYIKENIVYWGEYASGLRSGVGWIYKLDNEDIIFGTWANDKLDLSDCRLHPKSGDIYSGRLTENYEKLNGYCLVCSNKPSTENFFSKLFEAGNKKDLQGFLARQEKNTSKKTREGHQNQINSDNVLMFVGKYVNNKKHGWGKEDLGNGSVFEGNFDDGDRNGLGKILFNGLTIFKGEWVGNVMQGAGEMITSDGFYKGNLMNNLFSGVGTMMYKTKATYTGEWLNHLRHGQGVMKFPDGRIFKGKFENNGMKHGVMKWPDGRVYNGSMAMGKMSGRGVMEWPNNQIFEG
jgi:hypothetical protein